MYNFDAMRSENVTWQSCRKTLYNAGRVQSYLCLVHTALLRRGKEQLRAFLGMMGASWQTSL